MTLRVCKLFGESGNAVHLNYEVPARVNWEPDEPSQPGRLGVGVAVKVWLSYGTARSSILTV